MRAEYRTSISDFLQETGFGRLAVEHYADEVSMHRLRGELRTNEPMSKHTSWRAGGYAERYYMPSDLQDLAKFMHDLPPDERIYFVGLGSNLLVRDGGLRGTVIAIHARLNDLALVEQNADNRLIYASAGVACAKVARFAALQNLAGAEFLAGIPGTVGGALAMNAGCYGSETWEIVDRVQVIDRSGRISTRQPADYRIKYRSVALHTELADDKKPEWFVGGYFRLTRGDQSESRDKIKQLLAKRIESQPLNLPNAGSVFRNPPGDFAARLIELCNLKGFSIGGAMVSQKHANFIVNMGNATATDIETLIMIVQGVVKKQTGVELLQEVRIIGDARSRSL